VSLAAAAVGKVVVVAIDVRGMWLLPVVVERKLLPVVDVDGIRLTSVVIGGEPELSAAEFVGRKALLACGAELAAGVLVGREALLLLPVVIILPSMSVDVT
jgi:hypothetical protein